MLLLTLAALGGAGWWQRDWCVVQWNRVRASVAAQQEEKIKPDPATYATLKGELERWRLDLAKRYRAAQGAQAKAAVEDDARVLLEHVLPEMMRCWLGTPWDFHGTAGQPGEGKIACGYFVATVLKDAGFKVDRYRLAQQPSENILRSFLPKEACKLTVGQEYETFATGMNAREPGVYVVGLDTHVAFIVTGEEGFRFIHSSGSSPWCVVDEDQEAAVVLQRSKWRMIGNLTGDRKVIRRWLAGEKISVRGA